MSTFVVVKKEKRVEKIGSWKCKTWSIIGAVFAILAAVSITLGIVLGKKSLDNNGSVLANAESVRENLVILQAFSFEEMKFGKRAKFFDVIAKDIPLYKDDGFTGIWLPAFMDAADDYGFFRYPNFLVMLLSSGTLKSTGLL